MKNFTKTITNKTLFKPTRWLLMALMLLLGTSSAWAVNTVTGGYIYFNNATTNWSDASIQFVIGHNSYSSTYQMTKITNTKLCYYSMPKWDNSTYYGIIGTASKWGDGGWSQDNLKNATHYSSAYTSGFNLNSGSTYYITPSSSSNGCTLNFNYQGTSYTTIPTYTATLAVQTRKGISGTYSSITSGAPATLKLQGTVLSAHGTSSRTATGASEVTWPTTKTRTAVVTGLVTVSYSSLSEGYTFDGWYEGSTQKSTATSYSYNQSANTTITAKFTAKQFDIIYKDQGGTDFSGTHATGYPTTHTYGTATTLKDPTKSGYNFLGWFTNSDCTGATVTSLGATTYTANITLYAKWEQSCTRPVIVTNSATYNQGTGLVDINYSISETGDATTHYGIQYRAEGSPFPTEDLDDSDFIKIGTTSNTVTNATYTYQTVLTPDTYYFRTYANNGCPDFDYSVGMVYGQEKQVVVPKKDQPTLTLTGVENTYCTVPNGAITLSTTGGDGNGAVSYQIVNDGTTATASITTNQLTITSAGTLKLKAIKAADTNFNQAESAVVTVTIYADIEAGSISASATRVCQGDDVTLTLSGHTANVDVIIWYAGNTEVARGITEYTASNLQETTSYKVEVTRQDVSCDLKTQQTDPIQISVDQTSAITLSSSSAALCNGTTVDLTQLVSSNTGTVTWYSNEACTSPVGTPESITVNGNATYYAQAISGVCDAAKASYAITAKGVTISQDPATVHPYEVTTFTATGSASWEISTNPSTGAALDSNDPVFSGKTTAYITKAAGTTTTFKGEAATGYVIKATADDCETTQTFNVVADPDNCQ